MSKTAIFLICLAFCSVSISAHAQDGYPSDPAALQKRNAPTFGATLELRVPDRSYAEHSVYWTISKCGGYEQSVDSQEGMDSTSAITITARVPADDLDLILTKFQLLGTTVTKTVSPHAPGPLAVIDSRLQFLTQRQEFLVGSYGPTANQTELSALQRRIDMIKVERTNLASTGDVTTIQVVLRQEPAPTLDPGWLDLTINSAQAIALSLLSIVVKGFIWIAIMSPFYMPFLSGGWLLFKFRKVKRPVI